MKKYPFLNLKNYRIRKNNYLLNKTLFNKYVNSI